MKLTLGLVPK